MCRVVRRVRRELDALLSRPGIRSAYCIMLIHHGEGGKAGRPEATGDPAGREGDRHEKRIGRTYRDLMAILLEMAHRRYLADRPADHAWPHRGECGGGETAQGRGLGLVKLGVHDDLAEGHPRVQPTSLMSTVYTQVDVDCTKALTLLAWSWCTPWKVHCGRRSRQVSEAR